MYFYSAGHFDYFSCSRCGMRRADGLHAANCICAQKQRKPKAEVEMRAPTWFERVILRRPTLAQQIERWLKSDEAHELARKLAQRSSQS